MSLLVRVGEIDRRHPVLADSTLAALVAASGAMALLTPAHAGGGWVLGRGPTAVLVLTLAGQALPLVWLRTAPSLVATVVLGANLAQWLAGYSSPSTLGMLLALYAVARHDRFRRLCQVATASAAALAVPAFTFAPFDQQSWTSLFLLWCAVTAASALGVVARVRRERLEALRERAARLETEREQRAQLATLAERARVSREMHDIVGHHLSVMIGLADSAGFAADRARSTLMLRLIADTGRQALLELRRTLEAMRARPVGPQAPGAQRDELSPQPGLADLDALCERLRAAGPAVAYRTAGQAESVPAGVQLAAYRIVQEALTNTLKHAGADATVVVTVSVTERDVVVEVCDSGPGAGGSRPRGFGPADGSGASGGQGFGLGGIAERAKLTGGSAQAGPRPDGAGWLVSAVLPLPPGLGGKESVR